jgi:RES domain-containing protein
MEVYHLGLTRFARQLTGEGAKLHGGRWNQIGYPCLYAAESKALCALEYAANVLLEEMPDDLSFTTYFLPDESWAVFHSGDLPTNWKATPAPASTQEWGTKQLQKHLAFMVPSVIIPSEYNFIINPLHPEFKKVKIKEVAQFTFDRRIKK